MKGDVAEFRVAPTTINEPMFDVSVQGLTPIVHPYENVCSAQVSKERSSVQLNRQ